MAKTSGEGEVKKTKTLALKTTNSIPTRGVPVNSTPFVSMFGMFGCPIVVDGIDVSSMITKFTYTHDEGKGTEIDVVIQANSVKVIDLEDLQEGQYIVFRWGYIYSDGTKSISPLVKVKVSDRGAKLSYNGVTISFKGKDLTYDLSKFSVIPFNLDEMIGDKNKENYNSLIDYFDHGFNRDWGVIVEDCTNSKVLYANTYSGKGIVKDPDFVNIFSNPIGDAHTNLLTQLIQKVNTINSNGPWYIDAFGDLIYIHNQPQIDNTICPLYIYNGEKDDKGNMINPLLSFSFSIKYVTKFRQVRLTSTLDFNKILNTSGIGSGNKALDENLDIRQKAIQYIAFTPTGIKDATYQLNQDYKNGIVDYKVYLEVYRYYHSNDYMRERSAPIATEKDYKNSFIYTNKRDYSFTSPVLDKPKMSYPFSVDIYGDFSLYNKAKFEENKQKELAKKAIIAEEGSYNLHKASSEKVDERVHKEMYDALAIFLKERYEGSELDNIIDRVCKDIYSYAEKNDVNGYHKYFVDHLLPWFSGMEKGKFFEDSFTLVSSMNYFTDANRNQLGEDDFSIRANKYVNLKLRDILEHPNDLVDYLRKNYNVLNNGLIPYNKPQELWLDEGPELSKENVDQMVKKALGILNNYPNDIAVTGKANIGRGYGTNLIPYYGVTIPVKIAWVDTNINVRASQFFWDAARRIVKEGGDNNYQANLARALTLQQAQTNNALNNMNRTYKERQETCEMTCIGNPILQPLTYVKILGVGKTWSGFWYIKAVKHQISPSEGYTCSLTLIKAKDEKAAAVTIEAPLPTENTSNIDEKGEPINKKSSSNKKTKRNKTLNKGTKQVSKTDKSLNKGRELNSYENQYQLGALTQGHYGEVLKVQDNASHGGGSYIRVIPEGRSGAGNPNRSYTPYIPAGNADNRPVSKWDTGNAKTQFNKNKKK